MTSATSMLESVETQIVGSALRAVANELQVAMIRAAYSPVIKECFDCSAGIVGIDGEYWAQAEGIPLQLGVLSEVVRAVVETRDIDDLEPGDVLLTNDPASGSPHLNDFIALAPVFADNTPIAFVATLMHHSDVGGKTAGSMPADATELFQEGIRVPLRKAVRRGVVDDELLELLFANSRQPKAFRGDLVSQLGSAGRGVGRLTELLDDYGASRLRGLVAGYLDHTEQLMRSSLGRLAPGQYYAERLMDIHSGEKPDEPIHVSAVVTVGGDGVTVDFSGSAPQVQLPFNVVMSNGIAASLVALRSVVDPDLPMSGGIQRLLRVQCKPGRVMNPTLPAPLGARAALAALACECVVECLGAATTGGGVAASSGGTTLPMVWVSQASGTERHILLDNSLTGGTGATASCGGVNAIDNTATNAMNYPVEVLEADQPVLIERNEIRRGSGGVGAFRGGDGMRRVYRFLEPGRLSLRGYRTDNPPSGAAGGKAGAGARFTLRLVDGGEVLLAPQATDIAVAAGDALIAETPGGGGYGAVTVAGEPSSAMS